MCFRIALDDEGGIFVEKARNFRKFPKFPDFFKFSGNFPKLSIFFKICQKFVKNVKHSGSPPELEPGLAVHLEVHHV